MVYELRFCTHLQGNVFALVPDTLQQSRLPVVKIQQLRPHRVVDVKQVVGVCPGILHHLIWQGAILSSYKTIIVSTIKAINAKTLTEITTT